MQKEGKRVNIEKMKGRRRDRTENNSQKNETEISSMRGFVVLLLGLCLTFLRVYVKKG